MEINNKDKKVAIIFFSSEGMKIAQRIQQGISDTNFVSIYRCPAKGLYKLTKDLWISYKSIIFISSTGIAVRAIASNIESKLCDPAVLVIDEKANHIISLLSGHYGGANSLTLLISKLLNSNPVITTATDVNNVFSFDSFANHNNLKIKNSCIIKKIARNMIDKKYNKTLKDIKVYSYSIIENTVPNNVILCDNYNECDVIIGYKNYDLNSLFLIPSNLVLGIGCKKDTSFSDIAASFSLFMKNNHIFEESIGAISSIDLKKEEQGILLFAKSKNIPFYTYSSDKLKLINTTCSSEFVKKTTGVGCVCESAAIYHSNKLSTNNLIVKKTVINHITYALCKVESKLYWN